MVVVLFFGGWLMRRRDAGLSSQWIQRGKSPSAPWCLWGAQNRVDSRPQGKGSASTTQLRMGEFSPVLQHCQGAAFTPCPQHLHQLRSPHTPE